MGRSTTVIHSQRPTTFIQDLRIVTAIEAGQAQRRATFAREGSPSLALAKLTVPDHMELLELWTWLGPGLAGAVFGGAWWFWVDAVVCSDIRVPFLHYLPGIFATFAALMFNVVRRDALMDYSSFDENVDCQNRSWLFLAYVIAFSSLAGSVGMLVQDALLPDTPSTWTGIAGVLQCSFCLASGLMYWTRTPSSDY